MPDVRAAGGGPLRAIVPRRLPPLAALIATLAVVGACGGAGTTPVTTPTDPVPAPTPSPSLTPVPGSVAPATGPVASANAGFEPPAPACPGPPVSVDAPRILATSGGASLLMDEGSTSVLTCSVTSSSDVIGDDPTVPLGVTAGGVIRLSLPAGWRFLYWEAWDRSAGGEGANVTPGGPTKDRPLTVDIPVPARPGQSIVGVSIWVIGLDGRVVAQSSGTLLVDRKD